METDALIGADADTETGVGPASASASAVMPASNHGAGNTPPAPAHGQQHGGQHDDGATATASHGSSCGPPGDPAGQATAGKAALAAPSGPPPDVVPSAAGIRHGADANALAALAALKAPLLAAGRASPRYNTAAGVGDCIAPLQWGKDYPWRCGDCLCWYCCVLPRSACVVVCTLCCGGTPAKGSNRLYNASVAGIRSTAYSSHRAPNLFSIRLFTDRALPACLYCLPAKHTTARLLPNMPPGEWIWPKKRRARGDAAGGAVDINPRSSTERQAQLGEGNTLADTPVILFFHGGAFALLKATGVARDFSYRLAQECNAVVFSVSISCASFAAARPPAASSLLSDWPVAGAARSFW